MRKERNTHTQKGRETNKIQKEEEREWENKSCDRTTQRDGKRERVSERVRGREVVGVGGYQGQEQLTSPTPAVPGEGRQPGRRRWAISGSVVAAAAPASSAGRQHR